MFWIKKPPPMAEPTNTVTDFLRHPLVSSRLEEKPSGDLVRVEVRKCETTGATLEGRFPVPSAKPKRH